MEETQDLRVLNTNSVADKMALCIAPDHLGYNCKSTLLATKQWLNLLLLFQVYTFILCFNAKELQICFIGQVDFPLTFINQ